MPKIDGAVVAAVLADRGQLVAFAAMVLSCGPMVTEARMGYDAHGDRPNRQRRHRAVGTRPVGAGRGVVELCSPNR
ncbi:MAG: hypothetical protein WCF33_25430 [Pseudonocardiaceae bacterium]